MPWISEEQINAAKEVDLLSYLQAREPWELKKGGSNEYRTATNGSLVISNGLSLLGRVGNNINQIARRVNQTGSLHSADMEDMKRHMDEIWGAARKILSELARIK